MQITDYVKPELIVVALVLYFEMCIRDRYRAFSF